MLDDMGSATLTFAQLKERLKAFIQRQINSGVKPGTGGSVSTGVSCGAEVSPGAEKAAQKK